jgi:hypothetical protein
MRGCHCEAREKSNRAVAISRIFLQPREIATLPDSLRESAFSR